MAGEGSLSDKQYILTEPEMTLVLNMIAVISKRGGFMPNEFKIIGEFWEKFSPTNEELAEPETKTPIN